MHRAFASIAPGLEEALADELRDLGIAGEVAPGGFELRADAAVLSAVHLWSRLAARVTVEVGRGQAKSLDQLAQRVRALPWKDFVVPGQAVEIHATTRGSQLRHKSTVEKKVALAIGDAMRGPRLPGPRPPREPISVLVRLEGSTAHLSVDASGDLLHRRGWRKATAKAPLRENLAAAVLRLADWAPGVPLVDPMCGAGTFPIEAAHIALNRAPGLERTFAFQRWPSFDAAAWTRLEGDARRRRPLDTAAPILAADRDAGAVRATRSNLDRAGAARRVDLRQRELAELEPPSRPGLVVINPPYGERIGGSPGRVYRAVGDVLRTRWSGWRVAILLPGPKHLGALGLPLEVVASFKNGGIPVALAVGEI